MLLPRTAVLFLVSIFISGCALWRVDPMHPLIRSDVIHSEEQEREILSRANLGWTKDGRVRVLYLRGTPYERGYQQGKLLREEVQDNIGYIYEQALSKFHSAELFNEVYERMRPFIPQEYVDEMHGLAHGARMPLEVIHAVHVLADMGEWGGKRKLKPIIDEMLAGDLATMCSNVAASASATADGELYAVRILDWGLHKISKLHRYPLITVNIGDDGFAAANIGWVGYLGAVSGMNEAGITLGEMGYRDPDGETLRGTPMPFVLREVIAKSRNLADVRQILQELPGTNSYVFLMTDGKTKESEFYVRDRSRFLVFKPSAEVSDGKEFLPAVRDVSYGGRYNTKLTAFLNANHGKLTPKLFMEQMVPEVAMQSNFQNVIYIPSKLQFYLTNAASKSEWAASQPYTFFDLAAELRAERDLRNKVTQ